MRSTPHRNRAACLSRAIALLGVLAALARPLAVTGQAASAAVAPDDKLKALAFLEGRWRVPSGDPALEQRPDLAGLAIIEATWVVGGKAMRWRDHVRPDGTADAEGLVYWDPATEQIRFIGVGGPGDGQGRLFVGTWTPLADGRVERMYDVYYRTPADMPGEELGGSRRRYRDVYTAEDGDAFSHSLEWWHEGRWQPYGRGQYRLVREEGAAASTQQPGLDVQTASGSELEEQGRAQLQRLVSTHDVNRWLYTHYGAHPVARDSAQLSVADPPEGANGIDSTYRHLIVCTLELEALAAVVGRDVARRTLGAWQHHTWVYRTVLEDRDQLVGLLERHGLDTAFRDAG